MYRVIFSFTKYNIILIKVHCKLLKIAIEKVPTAKTSSNFEFKVSLTAVTSNKA